MSHSSGSEEHIRKRRRLNRPQQSTDAKSPVQVVAPDSGFWSYQNFFAVDTITLESFGDNTKNAQTDLFFGQCDDDIESWSQELIGLPPRDLAHLDAVTDILFPILPSKVNRQVDLDLLNPFAKHAKERPNKPRVVLLKSSEGEVNGYIKFRIQPSAFDDIQRPHLVFSRSIPNSASHSIEHRLLPREFIPLLPPDFGRGLKLDPHDSKLFTFCKQRILVILVLVHMYIFDPDPVISDLIAYCQGRTFLRKTNYWLSEVSAMAASEPGVKHGILALAGSYVLDYVQSQSLKQRTDEHYAKVSEFIGKAIPRLEHHAIENSDSLVAAISLLIADDVMNLPPCAASHPANLKFHYTDPLTC